VKPRTCPAAAGSQAPHVGARPRAIIVSAVLVAAGAVACSQSSDYQTQGPIDLGMTSSMAAYYSDENTTLYEAQTPVALPVKAPTGTLGATPAGTPYSHAPWLTASDESIEVHYTISNLDSQQYSVWLLIDPWNEFVRWDPGVTIVDDEDTEPNWGYDQEFVLPGMSRITGTLTTDDMQEIATKLAAVENMLASAQAMAGDGGPTNDGGDTNESVTGMVDGYDPTSVANNIFNPQNRSNSGDALYNQWIPPVIAGLTGFDLGLRTESAANIEVEITIDVQDVNGNRFVQADTNAAQLGVPPMTLSPPGALF
jgi:hypothetical protein